MRTELVDPVHYQLPVGETLIDLNPLLGRRFPSFIPEEYFVLNALEKRIRASIRGTVSPVYVDWLHAIRVSSGQNYVIIMKEHAGSRSGGRPIVCNLTWCILPILPA